MDSHDPLAYRRAYARQVLAKAGISDDPRLLAAFSSVPRENFVGPPPWFFSDFSSYCELASHDPLVLYQDMLVGLNAARGVNNGMPSLHASALHTLSVRDGETVAHMGAGSGYYSAILSELVGSTGKVIAVEYDAALAERLAESLAGHPNVQVVHGDATRWPEAEADVVYANFALDHPPAAWIDNLALSGRLLFPLGIPELGNERRNGFTRAAAFLLIDRRARGFGARFIRPVSFIWAEGQEPAPAGRYEGLEQAFRSRRASQVRSFRWRQPSGNEEWYGEEGWGLSFDEI